VQKMRSPHVQIQFSEGGFVVRKRRWLWSWTEEPIRWTSISSIRAVMWDCFSCHAFGYRFLLSGGASVCVTDLDLDDRWEEFRRRLHDACPGIDSEVEQKVEAAFPGEIELTCWENQQAQQGVAPQSATQSRQAKD
jgi:hypothetical protein